jgi:hypothetical protein
VVRDKGSIVHLAYLDDSGSDKESPIVVFGGVVIPDMAFSVIEHTVGWVVEHLIPEGRVDSFEEFHAAHLYWGEGAQALTGMNAMKRSASF